MPTDTALAKVISLLGNSIEYDDHGLMVVDEEQARAKIGEWARFSALDSGEVQAWARYLTRLLALDLGAIPASIHELYMARGRGEVPPIFTVPAMNLRALPYDAARAVFRDVMKIDAGAFIFEIARSEIGYTDQRPAEYATNVLCAAIAEGYHGPVFIQGDHFQVPAKKYAEDPKREIKALEDLCAEALGAGFFNIDIDASTIVDLSLKGEREQQRQNAVVTAHLTDFIRQRSPEAVTVSIGGEIGEVGGRNSNEIEMRAFIEDYGEALTSRAPGIPGLSKISIQTGTSHGGVVLADGSLAKVKVDFDTLRTLSKVAREGFGFAGAVQHGASTLPESAFGKFVESEACEVHLATNFQNMCYDCLPEPFMSAVYLYVNNKFAKDRKPDQTIEQFHYSFRKQALGPFKADLWNLDKKTKADIVKKWEDQFAFLFEKLAIAGTRKYVDQFVKAPMVMPDKSYYFGDLTEKEEVKDLAD